MNATLPYAYLLAKAAKVMPLFQEARDALPVIREDQRIRAGLSATLADRMDAAGTYSLADWEQEQKAAQTTGIDANGWPVNDLVNRSKRVLAAVDAYVDAPTKHTRGDLRTAIMTEIGEAKTEDPTHKAPGSSRRQTGPRSASTKLPNISRQVILEGDFYALKMHSAQTALESKQLKDEWVKTVESLFAASPAQPSDAPMASTIEEAARDVAKCLNERGGVGLDLRHVAMLAHHAQPVQPSEPVFWAAPEREGVYQGSDAVTVYRTPKAGWEPLYRATVAQAKPVQPSETDSMGIPLSCGKPLCSPSEHHPLCKLATPVAQTAPTQGGATK